MNILHHKSWHVLRKDNIARVRRDEAKAAEEEKKQLDRQILAENERRLEKLRARADARIQQTFGIGSSSSNVTSIQETSGHVNLFKDWEEEERKNLGSGNKEYEEEKAKEKREWESKMGIQVYFADGTNDLEKKKEWYEKAPVRYKPEAPKTSVSRIREEEKEKKRKRKRDRSESEERSSKRKKKKKDKKKKRKREKEDEEELERERKSRLSEMRDERLRRERDEKARTFALLNPHAAKAAQPKQPKYSSQFNPELAR